METKSQTSVLVRPKPQNVRDFALRSRSVDGRVSSEDARPLNAWLSRIGVAFTGADIFTCLLSPRVDVDKRFMSGDVGRSVGDG